MMKAKYLLVHTTKESVSGCVLPIEKGKYEVWTKEQLWKGAGHEPYHTSRQVMRTLCLD